MSDVLLEDALAVASDPTLPWAFFDNKTIVITGATGLIGRSLVLSLLARAQTASVSLRVIALVRNEDKARAMFGTPEALELHHWDASHPERGLETLPQVDVIFHCANMTDSAAFVERPIEVIDTTVGGARAMIELALRDRARLCLLSTMETYGEVSAEGPIDEAQGGFLDAMVVRNSYPEAKRLDEMLCAAYVCERGLDGLVVRLVQTFGPGVAPDDRRVFAYFARQAMAGEDIVMLTDGSKRNSYLYTADAVRALLCAAARGEAGLAYNAANDGTFCAVRDMAELVAKRFGGGSCSVRFEIDPEAAKRFRKGSVLQLSTERLRALGWAPRTGLEEMYERMMTDWDETSRTRSAEEA